MRRVLAALFLFALATSGFAENRVTPLTRAIADSLYAKLAGGSTIAGTTTFANLTVSGTCTGCGGAGTVTSVGAGTIASIFTFSVATATTTPAISLSCPTCATSANDLSFFSATSSAQLLALVSDETGTGLAVFNNSPTIVTPTIASFVNATHTHADAAGGGSLANAIGLPISTGVTGLGTGIATLLGTPSSANLRAALTDESGTGAALFAGGAIGAATATSLNGNTFTTGTYTLTGAASKTFTFNNTITLAGTDGTTMTLPSTSATIARTDAGQTFTGNNQINGNLRVGSATAASTVLHVGVGDTSATAAELRIDSGNASGAYAALGLSRNGSNKAYFAVVSQAGGEFIPSSVSNDLTIRGQRILFSADNGTTKHGEIATTGSTFIGTTTNDSAATGFIGEYITGTVAANTTSLSTGTSINVGTNTNITLTAGDWDCTGVVNFTFGATTSITNLAGGVSTTTGTLPAQDSYFDYETAAMVPTGTAVATWLAPSVRLSLSTSTSVFLVTQATFTLSTVKAGGTIRCRRMR